MLFLQLEEEPMGKEKGDGGETFFWEKLHSRGLRQEQRENYSSTESQSQYKKKDLSVKKGLSGQKRWPIQMLKTPEFSK